MSNRMALEKGSAVKIRKQASWMSLRVRWYVALEAGMATHSRQTGDYAAPYQERSGGDPGGRGNGPAPAAEACANRSRHHASREQGTRRTHSKCSHRDRTGCRGS